jgi:hypothetical protein
VENIQASALRRASARWNCRASPSRSPGRAPLPLLAQAGVQGLGGHGGGGHALPVDRVERADGVPEDDEPFRPPRHPLEVPLPVGRAAVSADLGHRFGVGDGLGDDWRAQAAHEGGVALLVRRWVLTAGTHEGDHPLVVLDREQVTRARHRRWP